MFTTDLDLPLQPFRDKTKVRGQNFSEKLLEAQNRWKKVAEDSLSGTDKSSYRSSFGKVHQQILDLISGLRIKDEVKLQTEIRAILEILFQNFRVGLGIPAYRDAYGYLIAEIEIILN